MTPPTASLRDRLLAQANCESPPLDDLLREAAAALDTNAQQQGEVDPLTDQKIASIGNQYGVRCYTCDGYGRNVTHTSWKFTPDELRAVLARGALEYGRIAPPTPSVDTAALLKLADKIQDSTSRDVSMRPSLLDVWAEELRALATGGKNDER